MINEGKNILKATSLLVALGIFCSYSYSAQETIPFKPVKKLEGLTISELSAAWWQWAMATPADSNPVRDDSGVYCNVGQQGKIWFLAGGFGSSKIKRTCEIPADKYLFFPVINMVYWPHAANNGYSCDEAKANAAVNNDSALDLFAEIDGQPIPDLKKYRAKTHKCFDIFERVPRSYQPYKAYPSASDGYWILLQPLSKGQHTLKFGGRYNNTDNAYGRMIQDIEYELIVK